MHVQLVFSHLTDFQLYLDKSSLETNPNEHFTKQQQNINIKQLTIVAAKRLIARAIMLGYAIFVRWFLSHIQGRDLFFVQFIDDDYMG